MSNNKSIDIKDHTLGQAYFYLTKGCNLRCKHCWIAPEYQKEGNTGTHLSFDIFKSIIAQAKPLGLSEAKLTGGEPLLHPRIIDILDHLLQEGIKLNIETNGTLCTPELAKKISLFKDPMISVSIDAVDAQTHEWLRGVKGCHKKALTGVQNLVNAGLKPQIIMTLMRKNKGQVNDMIALAEKLGAGSVKFNMLQPTKRGMDLYGKGEALTIEELLDMGRTLEKAQYEHEKLTLIYCQPPAFQSLKSMFGDACNSGCRVCGIKNIIGVLPDGSYALCGIGSNVPELIFGNAEKDRLEDVWINNEIINDLRFGLPAKLKGVCGKCLMKNICLGSCIAQNYYRSKDIYAPFWYCEEAYNKGAFPPTRLID